MDSGKNKNLIPLSQRTKDVQRAIQSKGGTASGKTRRDNKKITKIINDILSDPVIKYPKIKDLADKMELENDSSVKQLLVIFAILNTVKNADLEKLLKIAEMLGENTINHSTKTIQEDPLTKAIKEEMKREERQENGI